MSAHLVLLVLIGTAAIVWSACFVGCTFVLGLGGQKDFSPFNQYQGTVLGTPGLVAFWPLSDTSGTTATDIGPNNFSGTYTGSTYTLGEPNIVAGDSANAPSPCVLFDGGYVNVPYQAALGAPPFTIEAWVKPNWSSSGPLRVVVASVDLANSAGFVLFANASNLWEVQIGTGSQYVSVTTGNNQQIMPQSLYFLVVTYDGSTLTLWVNPADDKLKFTKPATYVPVPSAIPFFIGMGRPDQTPPMFPFDGWIQDVAFYNVVLDDPTIAVHYMNGAGIALS